MFFFLVHSVHFRVLADFVYLGVLGGDNISNLYQWRAFLVTIISTLTKRKNVCDFVNDDYIITSFQYHHIIISQKRELPIILLMSLLPWSLLRYHLFYSIRMGDTDQQRSNSPHHWVLVKYHFFKFLI